MEFCARRRYRGGEVEGLEEAYVDSMASRSWDSCRARAYEVRPVRAECCQEYEPR